MELDVYKGCNENHLFERFSTALHYAVRYFNSGHTTRVGCARIPIGDVGNVFETQLSGIENPPERL